MTTNYLRGCKETKKLKTRQWVNDKTHDLVVCLKFKL